MRLVSIAVAPALSIAVSRGITVRSVLYWSTVLHLSPIRRSFLTVRQGFTAGFVLFRQLWREPVPVYDVISFHFLSTFWETLWQHSTVFFVAPRSLCGFAATLWLYYWTVPVGSFHRNVVLHFILLLAMSVLCLTEEAMVVQNWGKS